MNKTAAFFLLIVFSLLGAENSFSQCTINTSSMGFGNYDVFANVPLDSAGTVSVSCSKDIAKVNVTLSASPTSGIFSFRRMKRSGGGDLLDYNIYLDVARTIVFGNGTGGTSDLKLQRPAGKLAPWFQNINIYGRIPPGQDVTVGSYLDILAITVNW